ncbi:hypothetical protein ABZ942_41545 [Nocardia sp. NPDC046473]|uniref:hypothetical protein n=1 Tax=Nocardia sp. NPDC046473 TaxID=3155733 RepID=UPI0033EFA7AE
MNDTLAQAVEGANVPANRRAATARGSITASREVEGDRPSRIPVRGADLRQLEEGDVSVTVE